MNDLSRRNMIHRAGYILASLCILPLVGKRANAGASCTDPSSESLRSSLHYSDTAPNAAQSCSGCGFFTAGNGGCGTCTIMSGSVSATGHCDSWSARG